MKIVDFGKLISEPRAVVSGREVGRNFRAKLGGDDSFSAENTFELIVPTGIKVITPSVFLGLLGREMKKIGTVSGISKMVSLKGASTVTKNNFMTAARTSLAKPL